MFSNAEKKYVRCVVVLIEMLNADVNCTDFQINHVELHLNVCMLCGYVPTFLYTGVVFGDVPINQ